MGDKTGISWTDASWNPVVGCTKVSQSCKFCYAGTLHDNRHRAWKEGRHPDTPAQYRRPFCLVQLIREGLKMPRRWTKPRMIFVNSMSDLFHPDVPDAFILDVFAIMEQARARGHIFQVLTKRPERMAAWVTEHARRVDSAAGEGDDRQRYRLVWLGTSVEDQRAADERIPHLLATPTAVRFLSCEPLLTSFNPEYVFRDTCYDDPELGSPIESDPWDGIHWVICGGESGSHLAKPGLAHRAMKPEWARDLRDQCVAAGVPFFMKQHSALRPGQQPFIIEVDGSHTEWHQFPQVARIGVAP
jgi:protein gp37